MSYINYTLNKQKEFYYSGRTRDIKWRVTQLKNLKCVIKKYEEEILIALKKDLNKSKFESYTTEVGIVYEEINIAIKNIYKWSKQEVKKTPLTLFPAKSKILKEGYGVVLIIGPFNYPFQLCIAPLIGAIAAGNCVTIKPSEYSIETASIIYKIINETFDKNFIVVAPYQKGREVVEFLIKQPFDYIFFTGSVKVGKIVMKAASENLIPVTLELGGKSPCIVDKDCNLKLAAKRIIWGKLLNAGQTCVAPDYIYVHENIKSQFLNLLIEEIKNQFGDNIENNSDYPKIINEGSFNRLVNLIDANKVYYGGKYYKDKLLIEPTIIDEVSYEDDVMQQEIFGPIIPVMIFSELDSIIKDINLKEKPLALYYFSEDKVKINKILTLTSSGGVTINDTIIHVASSYLPFGGVGQSGFGLYHGKYSFDTFSHNKSVVIRQNWLDISLRYAPFKNNLNFIKRLLK